MGTITDPARELESKVEVLRDLEGRVGELMELHERKRDLWFPSDLLGPEADTDPDEFQAQLRARAQGIPDHARAALALNLLTEEGLPHFHRLLAVYLGDESYWRLWNNLWTAEEDRHGQVLHDYARDTRLFDQRKIEEMQFEYLRRGFHPAWDRDPYRVFAYTTVQERATQFSHSETGKIIGEYEPRLGEVLSQVAKDEARHLLNVNREPVVTVQFRRADGRQITSCRGDSHILEEASINAGRFTLMCTSRSGAQRPVQVGGSAR